MKYTVLFDVCVLYPAPLRDLLLRLSITGLFYAKWTDMIHEEWIRNLSKNRPELAGDYIDTLADLFREFIALI